MATVFWGPRVPPSSIQYDYAKRAHKPTALRSQGKAPAATRTQVSNANPPEFDPLENLRRRRERAFLLELRRASLLIVASERDCKEVTSATLGTGTRVASQTSRGFAGNGEDCQGYAVAEFQGRHSDQQIGEWEAHAFSLVLAVDLPDAKSDRYRDRMDGQSRE